MKTHATHATHSTPAADPDTLEQLVRAVAEGTAPFDHLIQALMPMIQGTETLPTHVALGLSTVLIEIERDAYNDDQLYSLVNTHGGASVALSEAGQILSLNTDALDLFHLTTGDGLAALRITREDFLALQRRLSDESGPSLVLARPHRSQPVMMSAVYHPAYRAFVLTALQYHWPQSVDRALAELYHLSPSEREVLAELSRGRASEAIAAVRNRAIGTVRQQIKSILQKLNVSTQLEAATIAATAVATATTIGSTTGHAPSRVQPAAGPPNADVHAPSNADVHARSQPSASAYPLTIGPLPPHPHQAPLRTATFLRGRRRIGWRHFGDPEGHPVLYLHGPSFGAGEYAADRHAPRQHRLSIHAIERPGYGRTAVPGRNSDILDCHIQDTLALLDREQLPRVTILAHEVGLIPALALASRAPDRVQGILAVSAAPPFLELEQIQAMPPHQGIFIQAARHAPWLARLMVRLLLVRARHLGPGRWTDVIFDGVDHDSALMNQSAFQPGIIGTYSFYLNQMGAGFEQDLQMMLKDWSPLLTDAPVPLTLIHGRQNTATPASYLSVFTRLRPNLTIQLVDGAGLTLAVSHTDHIYQRLHSFVLETQGA